MFYIPAKREKCSAFILKNIFTYYRNSGWQILSLNILKKSLLCSDFHVFDEKSIVTVTFVSRWLMCHCFSLIFFQIVLFLIFRGCTVMCFDAAFSVSIRLDFPAPLDFMNQCLPWLWKFLTFWPFSHYVVV